MTNLFDDGLEQQPQHREREKMNDYPTEWFKMSEANDKMIDCVSSTYDIDMYFVVRGRDVEFLYVGGHELSNSTDLEQGITKALHVPWNGDMVSLYELFERAQEFLNDEFAEQRAEVDRKDFEARVFQERFCN